jgi:hypothetical protein
MLTEEMILELIILVVDVQHRLRRTVHWKEGMMTKRGRCRVPYEFCLPIVQEHSVRVSMTASTFITWLKP